MAYIVYKDNSSYYVFAQLAGTASAINPNRIIENQPSYVISAIKEQVRLVSTGDVVLPGPVTTVDGTALNNGDRVLLTGQTTAAQNGIYFWDAAQQFLFRALDFFDVKAGMVVIVEEGVAEEDSIWILTTDNPITVNVTPLNFTNISGGLHAPTHLYGAVDAIDGDQLGIDYVPANYTPDTSGPLVTNTHHLTSHIQGIDTALGVAETLAATLLAGNTTGGTDLEVTSGDTIVSPDGAGGGVDLNLKAGDATAGDTDGGDIVLTPGSLSGAGADGEVRVAGDMSISGKLTVAGLIDPTGLIFEEAAAPSTTGTEGAIFVDTADNHLKYRAATDGVITDLLDEDLAATLLVGNTTGGTNIEVSSGDKIVSPVDASLDFEVGDGSAASNGPDLNVSAGGGGAGDTDGGDIVLTPGAGQGAGADGEVRVAGDAYITGKLTVDGIIDPTALVLNEAAAPTTGAAEGALFVSNGAGYDLNSLYYRPASDGVPVKLTEGGETLAATLVLGNTTGGNDIEMSNGDKIIGVANFPVTIEAGAAAAGDPGLNIDLTASDAAVGSGDPGGSITLTVGAGDGAGIDGLVETNGAILLGEVAAPAAVTSKGVLFVDTVDNHLKYVEEGGAVTDLLAGGGGGGLSIQTLVSDKQVAGTTSPILVGSFSYDPTAFSVGATFQFEAMLSVNNAILTGGVSLYNVTDMETVTGASFTTSATTPTRFNSGNLTVGSAAGNLKDSRKTYEVRITNDGALSGNITFLGSASMLTE